MERELYTVGQFAQKASVSTRTLRYYDQAGLLTPAEYSEAGYRLYADEDLVRLQYILALKVLGFSLDEIRACLQAGPQRLQEGIVQQKAMMLEKRDQLDAIIRALDETDKLLQKDPNDLDSIIRVIQAMQMEPKDQWVEKYLTPEQRKKMRELFETSYSDEAKRKLLEQRNTEEARQKSHEQYQHFRNELRRAVETNIDPASQEGQAVAKLLADHNQSVSQGDPNIREGMRRVWEAFNSLPEEDKPAAYALSDAEREFIKQAMTIFYQNKHKSQLE